jgi:hypothetical protein
MATDKFSVHLQFNGTFDFGNPDVVKQFREAAIEQWKNQLALHRGSQLEDDTKIEVVEALFEATGENGVNLINHRIVVVSGTASFPDNEVTGE